MLLPEKLAQENRQLKHVIDQKDQRIKLLEEYIRVQNQKQFGASSEKDTGDQGHLFNEAEAIVDAEEQDDTAISVPAHTRKKQKRVSIPDDLPCEDIIHDLNDADKFCPHDGNALTCIGE